LGVASSLLIYKTDLEEAPYWEIRHDAAKWLESRGREFPSITPTKRANALYYYKLATKWGDEKAISKYYEIYKKNGGTDKGLSQSIAKSAPLGFVPRALRNEFVDSLNEQQKVSLEAAFRWYNRVMGKPIPASVDNIHNRVAEVRAENKELKEGGGKENTYDRNARLTLEDYDRMSSIYMEWFNLTNNSKHLDRATESSKRGLSIYQSGVGRRPQSPERSQKMLNVLKKRYERFKSKQPKQDK